jgi:hypothetical protein
MRTRKFMLALLVIGLVACLLSLRSLSRTAPPTLTNIGTVRLESYHPYLGIIDWELDDMFSFADTTGYYAWNLRTKTLMRGADYEIEATKLLGMMRPYRKHHAWNELPADLKDGVTKSLSGRLPRQATITDCYYSPHKVRLAWRVTYWIKPPFAEQVGHWFAAYRRFSRPIVELWITDGTGQAPHLIGMQEGEPGLGFMEPTINGISGKPLIHGVVWSPREDYLGFVFKDVFYTVPVTAYTGRP